MINYRQHNHQLDVWALGILLFELVHGNAPFRGNQQAIARNQTRSTIAFKPRVSQEYKDLVNRFLKEDPDERIPLIQVFQHQWVLFFQQKFFASWQPHSSDDDDEEESEESETDEYDEEGSSSGDEHEEKPDEEQRRDDGEDDSEELEEPPDAKKTPRPEETQTQKQ